MIALTKRSWPTLFGTDVEKKERTKVQIQPPCSKDEEQQRDPDVADTCLLDGLSVDAQLKTGSPELTRTAMWISADRRE